MGHDCPHCNAGDVYDWEEHFLEDTPADSES